MELETAALEIASKVWRETAEERYRKYVIITGVYRESAPSYEAC